MEFKEKYNEYLNYIENKLDIILKVEEIAQKRIIEAMKYSINSGGKRLRPVLTLSVNDLLGGNKKEITPLACATELIHTYSLIHDDLPAMDNDDYRRGKLTNHKVFGEAIATLAGDALLNYSFEIMLNNKNIYDEKKYINAIYFIAKSSGVYGMVGGQVIDIEQEGKKANVDILKNMHRHKTGALIKASVLAPAILYGTELEIECLNRYADKIGLAFQVKDDILDVEGNFETIGKPVGSDNKLDKSTFVKLYGLDESKEILKKLINESIESLSIFEDKDEKDFLIQIANYIKNRNK